MSCADARIQCSVAVPHLTRFLPLPLQLLRLESRRHGCLTPLTALAKETALTIRKEGAVLIRSSSVVGNHLPPALARLLIAATLL